MNDEKIFDELEDAFSDVLSVLSAFDYFHTLFSLSQNNGSVEYANELCNILYILNQYASNVKNRISEMLNTMVLEFKSPDADC